MKHWLILMGILGGASAGVARGEPYWVAWEGDDFPENDGWERVGTGTRPTRTIHDGIVTFDSLASDESEDIYRMAGLPDPAPGEEFVVQWRLRVNQINWDNPNFPYDPGWSVRSADGWAAIFLIGVDELESALEQTQVSFEPGVFHSGEFRTLDMRTFTVTLDGALAYSGAFAPSLPDARVQWGDSVQGPTSNFDWDYFRFGVVPEPPVGLPVFTLALAYIARRR
jgi:hypothetical protein